MGKKQDGTQNREKGKGAVQQQKEKYRLWCCYQPCMLIEKEKKVYTFLKFVFETFIFIRPT